MIVYILTNNDHVMGVSVIGAYSTEEKAREEVGPDRTPPFFKEIWPVELDGAQQGDRESLRIE